jgi:hypothetical protein
LYDKVSKTNLLYSNEKMVYDGLDDFILDPIFYLEFENIVFVFNPYII